MIDISIDMAKVNEDNSVSPYSDSLIYVWELLGPFASKTNLEDMLAVSQWLTSKDLKKPSNFEWESCGVRAEVTNYYGMDNPLTQIYMYDESRRSMNNFYALIIMDKDVAKLRLNAESSVGYAILGNMFKRGITAVNFYFDTRLM